MASAVATRTIEIEATQVFGPERHVHFRFVYPNGSCTEATAMERTEPMLREILEDRWVGLVGDDYEGKTDLYERLSSVLWDIAEGLTRRQMGDYVRLESDGPTALDLAMDVDGLIETVHDWMLQRAAMVAARGQRPD